MRIGFTLLCVLGCAASHVVDEDAMAPSCLPACIERLFAGCALPTGECHGYTAALPDSWRQCYANGLVIEAQPAGGHRYLQGAEVCAYYESVSDGIVTTDTWRDRDGREAATVSRASDGGSWTVACGGEEHVVDPESDACAGDPWVRTQNPHSLSCPLGDACPAR